MDLRSKEGKQYVTEKGKVHIETMQSVIVGFLPKLNSPTERSGLHGQDSNTTVSNLVLDKRVNLEGWVAR